MRNYGVQYSNLCCNDGNSVHVDERNMCVKKITERKKNEFQDKKPSLDNDDKDLKKSKHDPFQKNNNPILCSFGKEKKILLVSQSEKKMVS